MVDPVVTKLDIHHDTKATVMHHLDRGSSTINCNGTWNVYDLVYTYRKPI